MSVANSFTATDFGAPAPTLTESGPAGGLASLGLTFNAATGVLSGTPTVAGTYALTFTASNAAGSVSQSFTLTVVGSGGDGTQTSVAGAPNPVTYGQSATFTATVTNTTTTTTPTGAVQFFDDGVLLGNGSALSGAGASAASTFTTSALPAGPQPITAVYTPTGVFTDSSGGATENVLAVTATGLVSSLNPSEAGQAVTFTATVTDQSGTAAPTGSVEFFDGTTALGPGSALTAAGASAASTFTTSVLPAGADDVIAVYTPTGDFVTSQGAVSQTVDFLTATGVVGNPQPVVFGDAVTFTATVTDASGTATPTGSVEFFDGATAMGPGSALSAAGASATSTFTTSALPTGPQSITAVYTPTGVFTGSSGGVTEDVLAVTVTGVVSSLNPSKAGQAVTFTATVTDVSAAAAPTGSVEFFDGATALGPGSALTAAGVSAASTFTTSALPAGADGITAVYTPTGDFVTSQGAVSQTVYAVTATVVTSSLNPSVFGDAVTFTAAVTNTSGAATPTGSVEFFNGAIDLGPSSALTGAGASAASTFTTSALPAGADGITAVYTPTGDFVGGSGGVAQHVQAATNTLASSTNPSFEGNAVTFTALIINNNGSATPTGTVEFFDGVVDLGPGSALTGAGSSATSTFTTSTLPVGQDAITAVYTPAGDFVGSSGTVQQVVIATVFPTPPAAIESAVLTADGQLNLFNQQTGAVATISPAGTIASVATALNGAGQTVVFAIVTGADPQGNLSTLWEYNPADPAGPWSEISTGSFTQISGADAASSVPAVFGVLGSGAGPFAHTLWEYDGSWAELSSGSFQSISAVSTPAGEVVYGVTAGGNLWAHSAGGWAELSSGSFQSISAGINSLGQTVVYGLVAGGSLWEQNPAGGTGLNVGWTELSNGLTAGGTGPAPSSFLSVAAGGADTAFAIAADDALWQYTNRGWMEISTGSFAQISATGTASGADLVFAALTNGELWDYDSALLPSNPWSQAATDAASTSTPT
ncbi:MAG TPA: Ig-like domain repeat protein [Gemmataceae bacterium]|nr:Ig-like domain repeat protein [Gemmataceae bacterium]